MENFSYPIKLEPLNRPVRRPAPPPQQSATPAAAASRARTVTPRAKGKPKQKALSLREERERKGVTLEQIAENTRIPLRHLRELERGEVSKWPGGIYAKSWARDYAREAGIDPDRVIAIVAPVAQVEPSIDEIKQATEERERTAVNESPLAPLVHLTGRIAAIAIVLVLLALAAFFFLRGDSRPADQPNPAPVGTSGATPGSPQR